MIQRRNGRRGVIVRRPARVAAAGLVARAAAAAGRAITSKLSNYRFRSGNTRSRFESNLGPEPTRGIRTSRIAKRILQQTGTAQAQTGNELSKFSTKIGRYPKLNSMRLLKLMKAGMNEIILRAQGITNFDTNVGYYPLANRSYTDGVGDVVIPTHVWDLSLIPNVDNNIVAGHFFGWDNVTAAANLTRGSLPTQLPDGSTSSSGYYQQEVINGALQRSEQPFASTALHEWTQVKMNLYGARKRGTTYYIDFVRCKDEFSNLVEANVANPDLKDLMRTLQSPLIYSNLQQHNPKNLRKLQIVKSYRFYVPGGSADDIDTIGKVKEFKCFLREGKVYNFAWQDKFNTEANDIPHEQEDGIDYVNKQQPHNSPWHTSRLYMIVRAFSPERRSLTNAQWDALSGQGAYMASADPLTEGSYDLIIRNKWTLPS